MNKTFELSKPIPFITAYSAAGDYRKYIGGFRYVSVLTDGSFNPSNNNRVSNPVALCPDRDNDSHCYLQFDNGERLQLNGEVKNFELPKDSKYLDLINAYAGISSCGTDTPETGYGNMYILLSMYPVKLDIPKVNPSFYIYRHMLAPAGVGEYHNYHFGAKLINAGDTLKEAWLPAGKYEKMSIFLSCDDGFSLEGYIRLYASTGDIDYVAIPLVNIGTTGAGSNGWLENLTTINGCDRVMMAWHNIDVAEHDFYAMVRFIPYS